jgi:threonine/homoserine/homoserine lactone efflux protein
MIEKYLIDFGLAYICGIIVPGPSIAVILKNSTNINYNQISFSMLTSFGVILGIAIQAGIVLVGMTFIDKNSFTLKFLQILCSSYLIYLGFNMFLAKNFYKNYNIDSGKTCLVRNKKFSYFYEGLAVEVLNPIAFIFFTSILITTIGDKATWYVKVICWVELILLGGVWFCGISFFITYVSKLYTDLVKKCINSASGIFFIFFGLNQLWFQFSNN